MRLFLQNLGVIGAETGQTVDLSGIAFFGPILAFLAVFVIVYAILLKSELLGENKLGMAFVSFLVATIFALSSGLTSVVLMIIPWFGVLLILMFTVLFLALFIGGDVIVKMRKPLAWGGLIFMAVVLIVSLGFVFGGNVSVYLPGPTFGLGDADSDLLFLFNWLYSPQIAGALGILFSAGIVGWVLVKWG